MGVASGLAKLAVKALAEEASPLAVKTSDLVTRTARRANKVSYVTDPFNREIRAVGPTGKEVGYLSLEKYGDAAKNNEVFNMAVKPAWQRNGLMTRMHEEAEKAFGTVNPSSTLSDDGFAFWKAWRPDAVRDRYRYYADRLLGTSAPTRSGIGVISSVGDKSMVATLPNGNTNLVDPIHAKSLFESLSNSAEPE